MKNDFISVKERLNLSNFEELLKKIKLLIYRNKITSFKKSIKRNYKWAIQY